MLGLSLQKPEFGQNRLAPEGNVDFDKSALRYARNWRKRPRKGGSAKTPPLRQSFLHPLCSETLNLASSQPFPFYNVLKIQRKQLRGQGGEGGAGIATARPAGERQRINGPRYALTPLYGGRGADLLKDAVDKTR